MTSDGKRVQTLIKVLRKGLDCKEKSDLSLGELSVSVARQLSKRKPVSIPYWVAWCMAKVGDLLGSKAPINSYKLEKMTKSLTFSNEKARRELGWEPLDVLENYKV